MLDNPVWHSLSQKHTHLGQGDAMAKRYLPEISPLAATFELSAEAHLRLARMLGLGQGAGLVLTSQVSFLRGLEIMQWVPVNQMVWAGKRVFAANPGEVLGSKDAPEMLALAQLTKPGPFEIRTNEMGRYIGIRKAGKLAAMAGERMCMPGFTEVSAVCTHPDHRGHGYAGALVLAMVTTIQERGDIPFLHVAAENASAIKIYEKLGFRTRRLMQFAIVKRAAA
jgi:ribosomal protein S18 acetylase RimI-like enzyme